MRKKHRSFLRFSLIPAVLVAGARVDGVGFETDRRSFHERFDDHALRIMKKYGFN